MERPLLERQLSEEIAAYNRKGVPDSLGMMLQAVQDLKSTVVVVENSAAMSYRVRRHHIKIMCLGSGQKGQGASLLRWVESRFKHKRQIRLWASPTARGFYRKMGYCDVGEGEFVKDLA